MVEAEVLLFVRLSSQFQELKAEKHPIVAVLCVLRAVSTEKIIIMTRAILQITDRHQERENELYLTYLQLQSWLIPGEPTPTIQGAS